MKLFPLGLAFALASPSAFAFQVSPMSATLTPTGREASATFEITNKSDKPVPIEVSINRRVQDLKGDDVPDTSAAAEEKFVIYPPQFILEPKNTRLVKVTWTGGKELAAEEAFRVNFLEVAVPTKKAEKAKKAQAKISLLVNYAAALYVRPPKATSKLVVASAAPSAKDANKLEVIVENQGSLHQMINAFTIKLEGPNNSTAILTDRDLPKPIQKNLLASSKLQFVYPWPKPLPKGPLKGTITVR